VRILGIDPGSRFTGYGIIEVKGERVVCVAHGVIKTGGKAGEGEFPERLGIIFTGIRNLITDHHPDQAAIETVFVSRNPNSALKLGQARGAAVCAVIQQGLTVSEYSPRSVKQAIVGRGSADKFQVNHMISLLLQVKEVLTEDAADALAVALCHHHTQQTVQRMHTLRG
jgi:crossover junction endodeoxyribonuclease RuvC